MTVYTSAGLPVALVGDPGAVVSLRALLEQSFGADTVARFGRIQISYVLDPGYPNPSYWNPDDKSVTEVLFKGQPIQPGRVITFESDKNLDNYSLQAGNLIYANVTLSLEIGDGIYQSMNVKTVPSELVPAGTFDGIVSPAGVVASARRLAAAYDGVPNADDCHFIAETIAAAAGATMPIRSGNTNPALNVEEGFWRIAHRGSTDPDPNWQSRLQAGDIVRVEWATEEGHHTFTVTSNDNRTGRIQVVDNGGGEIHQHWVDYGPLADPTSVTIYRLTTDNLYLTSGTGGAESLYGTVWNDDLRGYSGSDTLMAGLGDDRLDGGRGADRMFGGRGDDYYLVDNAGDVAIEKKGEGHDRVEASVSYDLKGQYVEDLTLTGSRDTRALGNSLDNFLVGNAGDNLIRGWGGNDTLMGGAGADTLLGGSGNDLLVGGTGADTFGFGTRSGNDFIRDFDLAAGDKIDLRGQTHAVWQLQDGNALLTLSGGGTVQLAGISASAVNANFFT